jgi:hypothetical protein
VIGDRVIGDRVIGDPAIGPFDDGPVVGLRAMHTIANRQNLE